MSKADTFFHSVHVKNINMNLRLGIDEFEVENETPVSIFGKLALFHVHQILLLHNVHLVHCIIKGCKLRQKLLRSCKTNIVTKFVLFDMVH